jgi:hypothetical protein
MVGLCLVAVFAMASVAATSASALPEWGQCYEKAGGKYSDSNCQVKSKVVKKVSNGTHEWRKGPEVAKKGFKGVGGTGILLAKLEACVRGNEDASCSKEEIEKEEKQELNISIECTAEHATGETSGTKEVKNVIVAFTGCKALGSAPCSNGPTEGEIQVNLLKGSLGYINKAKKEVGIMLTPVTKGGAFASFICGLGSLNLATTVGVAGKGKEKPVYLTSGHDQIISPVTPINTETTELTQVYSATAEDENIPNKFEGKPLSVLETQVFNSAEPQYITGWSKSAETVTNVNTAEEPSGGEIKG